MRTCARTCDMNTVERKGSKKVRTGDKVVVIAGNAKGQSGVVLACEGDRVVVQGVNLCKKHVKRSEKNPQGGVVEFEKSIHVSNVQPCDDAGNALKLKIRTNDEGFRELYYYKQDGQPVVWRSIKRSEKK